jgi:tetratricopeptide (TPR) repeat protein
MWWWAAVAGVAAIGFGIAIMRQASSGRAIGLLAQAYADRRPSEFRMPGAPYTPFRQQRGSANADPLALRAAQEIITRALQRSPASPQWLDQQGRAWLLAWRPDDALTVLNQAHDNDGTDTVILEDMAMAYFERAQVGVNGPADYGAALNLLSQAIAKAPGRAELRFNRAIVYEHLSQIGPAIREWDEFLRLERSGGWADEARTHLMRLGR